MNRSQIQGFMRRALTLAARGMGKTHPNPMVGAVVVKNGRIVGEGWHRRPGEPHAEALAIREAGPSARGGTLFVNLEPCDHTGRTPPCTQAIIEAGIDHVIAACGDPHPLVNGRGFQALRRAGIRVTKGVQERRAEELNRAFLHFSREGTPYLTLKLAATLDGRIAAPNGDSRWITSEKARKSVHRLRAQADAILVGVGTVLADDPTLTVRGAGRNSQPLRIVLDPALKTPLDSTIVRENPDESTLLVVADDLPKNACLPFEERGVHLLRLPLEEGFFQWKEMAGSLLNLGILHVLAEGGGGTAAWLWRESAVNRMELFLAPGILGASGIPAVGDLGIKSLGEMPRMSINRISRVGGDLRITADVK